MADVTRAELLERLTTRVVARRRAEPSLVAIDGRSAAGKTTLADELAERLNAQGVRAVRCSIDDFHPPGHKYRSMQRRYTPATYCSEGYDLARFRQYVLEPTRRAGAVRCRLRYWDSYNDAAFPEQWTDVPDDGVIVVDGMLLLNADLRPFWNLSIWLDIDWETMVQRAAKRDVAWAGPEERVISHYRNFWIPTHTLYETAVNPARFADLVVDNRNPAEPSIID